MTENVDVETAWKAVFSDPEWMFKTGIGGVLNALCLVLTGMNLLFAPVCFAIVAVICGYLLRTIRLKVENPENTLPNWDNWLELLISGLTWIVIQSALLSALILAALAALTIGDSTGISDPTNKFFFPWACISILAVSTVWLVLSFLTPFLMVNFAIREELSAGFRLADVVNKISVNFKTFLVAWLLSVGVGWASFVVPAMTIFGVFFLPTTVFVAYLISALLAAQAWSTPAKKQPG